MAIQFTPDQQKVIDLHGKNILVSAAAGSGKTAVLVERIIQLVCNEENQVDIDRLLIVTFTNAAAAEMRERISAGIAAMQEKFPESEHIERQATLLHNAQITTIDSFCLYLVKNHFQEIGLDPAFRVADMGEIKLMKQEVLAELLEEHFAQKQETFSNCVEFFCPTGKENALEDIILNLHTYADSNPWPEVWLETCRASYEIETVEDLEKSPIGEYAQTYLKKMFVGFYAAMKRVQKLCLEPDGPYMYEKLVESEAEQLEKLCTCTSLGEWEVKLQSLSFKSLPSKKDDTVNPEKREYAKELRDRVKKSIKIINEQFFGVLLTTNVEQIKRCKEPVNTLLDLTLEFGKRLGEKKRERKVLDFSDMEHYALEILLERDGETVRPGKVAKEYREYFKEILIDEYQDSNLVQEYLLLAVSGEDDTRFNRFMVGDVKQSIYKFRLARPELFLEKYRTYESEVGECRRIDLSQNFRSRETVLNTVNHVFERLMSEEVGGIPYDAHARLYPGAVYPEYEESISELLLLNKPSKESGLEVKEAEAYMLARKIKELKAGYQVTDKKSGELRPVQNKDMVILLRTTTGWDETFKSVLEKEGIPVYITSKTGYFAATEVQELLQLLRVLDNPGQDIPLFGTMKSVFGGFSEEEIALIRSGDKKARLWEQVCGRAQNGDEKCAAFVAMIERYRAYAVYMPIRELLQTLVEEFSYLPYVTALPGGNKRKINVEMLFIKAADFERTSYFGLFHFVRYIEQLEKYDVDYGQDDMLDENADVVRIMSIHKSKGLEFPVTFVSGLSKQFNMNDLKAAFLMDMDFGVGTDYVNAEKRYKAKTFYKNGLVIKLKEELLAEELRVLYVALTRAKEKLIMTSVVDDAEEMWNTRKFIQNGIMSFEQFMGAKDFMDYLLPVLDESVVKVQIYKEADLQIAQIREQLEMFERKQALEEAAEKFDVATYEKLQEIFSYEYPYSNLQNLYTKTTVSELKIAAMADKDEAAYHQFEKPAREALLPGFLRESKDISATDRGNAYHKVMELLDFEQFFARDGIVEAGVPEGVPVGAGLQGGELVADVEVRFQGGELAADVEVRLQEFLAEKVARKVLSPLYAKAVNVHKLVNFLRGPLAKRMWAAQVRGELYREQPFVLGIPASKLGEQFPAEEKVLIQGIIDAFFVEDGQIVLLDYKTDKVQTGKELWDRYATQLEYYEEALSSLMQMPVKEKNLYSFSLEECVGEG